MYITPLFSILANRLCFYYVHTLGQKLSFVQNNSHLSLSLSKKVPSTPSYYYFLSVSLLLKLFIFSLYICFRIQFMCFFLNDQTTPIQLLYTSDLLLCANHINLATIHSLSYCYLFSHINIERNPIFT